MKLSVWGKYFYGLRGSQDFPREVKISLKPFFRLKRVWGLSSLTPSLLARPAACKACSRKAFTDNGGDDKEEDVATCSPRATKTDTKALSLRLSESRLSFPATGPPDPGTDFKAPGSLTHHRFDTFLKGFRRVLEGVLKGFWRVLRLAPSKTLLETPSETPSRNHFRNPSGVREFWCRNERLWGFRVLEAQ